MKTVLNRRNVPVSERIMFLGPDLSLQRYDQFKYPKFFDLWEKQENYRWRPQRIDLSKDRLDYERLNDTERHIFNSNIRWQTMTDSMLSRSIHKISEYVTNPELELCMGTWASMEQMHSFSYTHIFKNVTKNATAFFDSILQDDEIVRRAEEISRAYDALLGEPKNLKEKIFQAVLSTNITEGIAFYSSFICSFFFGYRGMMEGSAKIIGEIARDECLSDDTEVLTDKGWKRISEITIEDRVAQFDKDGDITFANPLRIVKNEVDENLLRFVSPDGYYESLVTANHRMVYQYGDVITTGLAKDLVVDTYNKKFIVSGIKRAKSTDTKPSDFHRFLIAVYYRGIIPDHKEREVFFKLHCDKTEEINYLKELFDKLDLKYTTTKYGARHILLTVKVPENKFPIRLQKSLAWMPMNKPYMWYKNFLDECIKWCGHIKDGIYHFSILDTDVDIMQIVATFLGGRSKQSGRWYKIHLGRRHVHAKSMRVEAVPYKGTVYCLTVPTGMFVSRYNGKVSVTGNCLHLAITQNIINNWKRHPEEGFQDIVLSSSQLIQDMFGLAVEQEKRWIEYLFSKGSLMGLNYDVLSSYIEWLANTRLLSIGEKRIFDQTKNPVAGWSTRYFDSKSVQVAPQETEVESYLIGGADTSINESEFDNLEL